MIDTIRLEAQEYPLLREISDGFVPEPGKSIAVIAVEGGMPIGRIFLLTPGHIEGVWLAPAWRNGVVMKRLVDAIENEARTEGMTKVLAYASDTELEGYIRRLGYTKVPVTVWQKELPCQSV